MEAVIADLVRQFDRGTLTRRQLIQGLTALAVAGQTTGAHGAQAANLRSTGIDHVSILVDDLQRSAGFYRNVFGLSPLSEDKTNRILRLGTTRALVSIRQQPPAGMVDHFAIRVEGFGREAVTAQLKAHGLTPQENIEFGYHIKDPDGAVVQIV